MTQPSLTQSPGVQSPGVQSSAVQSSAVQSSSAQPLVPQPSAVQSSVPQPSSAQPSVSQSSAARPSVTYRNASQPTVTVCRGCCCGTAKIPGVDHAEQLDRLRRTVENVRTSDCLDVCEYANVIVVQPSPAGRRAGGRPVWLGLANDLDLTADVAAWIGAGGPGLAETPAILELYVVSPPRRAPV